MFRLKKGIKRNPQKRWELPDRVFFGFGACHILAGTYLEYLARPEFYAVWIKPDSDYYGNHIFVTDGEIAFDYHGYCQYDRLVKHHKKIWVQEHSSWSSTIVIVDFDLLNTASLNLRKMRGPDQYFYNPISRAKSFIDKYDHPNVSYTCISEKVS